MHVPAFRLRFSIALLALGAVACGPGATPTTGPATAPAVTVAASTAPAATASPVATAAAVATPTAKPGPVAIADGTYVTDAIDVDDWRAAIEADDKLTDDEKTMIITYLFELAKHETIAIQLDLTRGNWTQSAAFDGGSFQVGSTATYAFPDASTVVISETCCGLTTFTVTPDGDGFSLDRVSGTQNEELDIITGELIFGTLPFHPAP